MGEKFAANAVTGTGSMSVPIATSPGRSGFGPQLSLSYDSGSGNGSFGLGWNLSLPSITRKTDKGLPKYRDAEESDVFILSGAEDLVPEFENNAAGNWILKDGKHVIHDKPRMVDGVEYRVRRYRPRIEGLFARIERWTDAQGVSHWRSISKDNITTLYGSTNESRIVDPSDKTRIFSWLICESYDDRGNAILYEYKKENSQDIVRSSANEANRQDTLRTANRYLKRIKYGNKSPRQAGEDLSARTDWMFEAVFDYGEHYVEDAGGEVQTVDCADNLPQPNPREWKLRRDPFSSYRAGFEVRTYRLCRRVLMFHHFDELGIPGYLVRATHFAYHETTVASFITGVTQSGYKRIAGIYRKKILPPVEFTYSQAVIQEEVREVDPASLENLPQGLDNSRYQWADLDGEGLAGILTEQGGAWFYKRNQSAVLVKDVAGKETTVARFAPLERVAAMPSSANLSGGQQLMDLAGNGQLDVVDFEGPTPGFFERTPDEEWDTHRPFTSLPNISWRDPNLKFIDLTGDGHADILITEDQAFTWYQSMAGAGF
ncbi:MAG: toxin, partial [Nitrospiraceae bacterium]|nr:toxin [Nitrospiraceae bacterium]